MQQAVDAMLRSRQEPRNDKASPLVGAVLLWPDGETDSACRGELRDGDHAEFTLLERKHRDKSLDRCVLYTTLEPCAEGARTPPKLSCSEHIVLARIKEVWIGIEDPDPKVARKGIAYLEKHGVKIHMFEREVQDQIRGANKEYLEQATQRARDAEVDQRPAEVPLSPLDAGVVHSGLEDFSSAAIDAYRKHAGLSGSERDESFHRTLFRQGLLDSEGKPTGFGLLLFGSQPRDAMPQAGVKATIHRPDGREEVRDFDGPMVLIPSEIERWLDERLPDIIDRSRMQRGKARDVPFELIREGIVNALVHRDYGIEQAKCQLEVTPDKIIIRSPGRPIAPITIEQLQRFNAPMLSRNPRLHYVFARMALAEERGLGMKTFREAAEKGGLPRPQFRFEDPYLVLTLFRSPVAAATAIPEAVLAGLTNSEREGWTYLAAKGSASRRQYEEHLGIDTRMAQRHLKRFQDLGLIRSKGRGRTTSYEVVESSR